MEPVEKCAKCGAAFARGANQVCDRCGWDSQIGMRKCTKCRNAVVLNEKIGFGPLGGLVGIGGFIFWRIFGLLLGLAIVCSIAAICGAITALTLAYTCVDCGQAPGAHLLDAEEKEIYGKRRLGFAISAG
ncbi:MAG: hypothetical protein JO332_15960, partial [Planctomycetaceae bacterium]|nr:hypothetical protein [Planctomycetaceae bacterium]